MPHPSHNTISFVAMDLETTGLNPASAQIVEIGAIRFQGDCVIGQFQTLVNPGIPIPHDAMAIHGITNAMVANQPSIDEALPRFLAFAEDSPLIIHNARFDLGFLSAACCRLPMGLKRIRVIDTLRLARKAFPRFAGHSLEKLVRQLQLSTDTLHRALADALCAMQIFRRSLQQLHGASDLPAEQILKAHSFAASLTGTIEEHEQIRKAIQSGQAITITYCDANNNVTVRSITPIALVSSSDVTCLEAFCHLRKENRVFVVNRILSIDP